MAAPPTASMFAAGIAERMGRPMGVSREIHELSDDEVKAIVEHEIQDALGNIGSELSEQRRQNLRYYNGEPFGNEQAGRSQVILTDVTDTIEWIMPSLVRMFLGGDLIGRYKPTKPEHEAGADQATDYINHLFLNECDAFVVMFDWMKTALIERNSITKAYAEVRDEPDFIRQYEIDENQLLMHLANDEIKIVEAEERGETVIGTDPISGQPVQLATFDVLLRRVKPEWHICVDAIPPEEFLIARRARFLNDRTPFSAHRVKRTASELISLGYPEGLILNVPTDDSPEFGLERVERLNYDESFPIATAERADAAAREIWCNECWIRMDADGDGYTELRKVVTVGDASSTLLDNDYDNFNPFCSIVPVPMPHKFFGLSVADLVRDLQLIRSTLLRQMLDNVYLVNNSRYAVVEGQVELDDLLTSLPGGVVRMNAPGMVEPLVTQPLGPVAFNMLEYLEGVRESRTGITRYNQGLDARSLNKTATGITTLMEAANARIELIARIFAETGFKQLFKKLLRLMVESPVKNKVVKLRGQWVTVDPSRWHADMDVEIEVGLGVGQAAERVRALTQLLEVQAGFIGHGDNGYLVTPQNLYNSGHEIAKAMGFRLKNQFFTAPDGRQPPPPPPQPDIERAKMEAQSKANETEVKREEVRVNALRIEHEASIKEAELEQKGKLERERMAMEERLAMRQMEVDLEKAKLQAEAQRQRAQQARKKPNGSAEAHA